MNLTTIRQAVRDDYTLETVANTVLDRRIAAAVRAYSRYNPMAMYTTFDTVADQAAYTLDVTDTVLGVWFALWWPAGEVYNELKASSEILYLLTQPAHYLVTSQRIIEDIKESAHIRALTGDWEWWPGTKEIALSPTPTASATTVHVTYWAAHALNEDGDAYETIPAEDLDIIVGLTVAELLEKERINAAAMPDMQEGLERTTYHHVAGNIEQTIGQLRKPLIDKYGGTAIMVGP